MDSIKLTLFSALALTFTATALPASVSAQDSAWANEQAKEENSSDEITGADLAAALKQVGEQMSFADILDPLLDEMLITGPAEEGWSTQGINLVNYLESQEGGLTAQILFEQDANGITLHRVGNENIPFPATYRNLTLKAGRKGQRYEHVAIGFAPGFWVGGTSPYKIKGNAMCSSGDATGFELYTDKPSAQWQDEDVGALAFIYSLLDSLNKLEICTVYYEASDGKLAYRVFTPRGEPYINMNAQADFAELRPAAKAAALISNAKLTNPFAE